MHDSPEGERVVMAEMLLDEASRRDRRHRQVVRVILENLLDSKI